MGSAYSQSYTSHTQVLAHLFGVLKRFYFFIFRERGRERERKGEKYRADRETLIGCQPQPMCPDQESPGDFHFAGRATANGATPVRAVLGHL